MDIDVILASSGPPPEDDEEEVPSGEEPGTEHCLIAAVSPFNHTKQASIRKQQATMDAISPRRDTMGSMDSEESYKSDNESQLGSSHSVPPEVYFGAASSRSSGMSLATYTPGSSPVSLPDGFGLGISPFTASTQRTSVMATAKGAVTAANFAAPPPLISSTFRSTSTSRGALSSGSGMNAYYTSSSYASQSQSTSSEGPVNDSSADSGDEVEHDGPRHHSELAHSHELQPLPHSSHIQQQQPPSVRIHLPLQHVASKAIRLNLPQAPVSPTSTSASYGSASTSTSFSPSSPSSFIGRSRSLSTPRAPSTPGSSSTPPLSPATMASEDSERPFGYGFGANTNSSTAATSPVLTSARSSSAIAASAHRLGKLVVHSVDEEDDDDEYTMLNSDASSLGSSHGAFSSSSAAVAGVGVESNAVEGMVLSEDSIEMLRLNSGSDLTCSDSITPSTSSSSISSDDSVPSLRRSSASIDSLSASSSNEPTRNASTSVLHLSSFSATPLPSRTFQQADTPTQTLYVRGTKAVSSVGSHRDRQGAPPLLPVIDEGGRVSPTSVSPPSPSASLNSPSGTRPAGFSDDGLLSSSDLADLPPQDTAIGADSSSSSKQQRSEKKTRGKRHSGASPGSRSGSVSSGSSSVGTMESMMFGWKLNKNSKARVPESPQLVSTSQTSFSSSALSFGPHPFSTSTHVLATPIPTSHTGTAADLPRKRSRSARLASPPNGLAVGGTGGPVGLSHSMSAQQLPFTSPLQHHLHAGFAPPAHFGVYEPQRSRSASLHSTPGHGLSNHPMSSHTPPPPMDPWAVAAAAYQQHQMAAEHAAASSSPHALHGMNASSPAAMAAYLSYPQHMVTSPTSPPDFGNAHYFNEQPYASPPQFGNPLLHTPSPHMSRSASFDLAYFAAAAAAASQSASPNANPLASPSGPSYHPHSHPLGQLPHHHHLHPMSPHSMGQPTSPHHYTASTMSTVSASSSSTSSSSTAFPVHSQHHFGSAHSAPIHTSPLTLQYSFAPPSSSLAPSNGPHFSPVSSSVSPLQSSSGAPLTPRSTLVASTGSLVAPPASVTGSQSSVSFASTSPSATKKHAVGLPGRNGTSAFQVVRRNSVSEVHPSTQNRSSVVSRASSSHLPATPSTDEPDSPPFTPHLKKKKKLTEV